MQLPERIMGAWNEGCRYISMAIYSFLPYCVLFFSTPASFLFPTAIWMALCLFRYLHGILTVHFKVTNSIWITEIPLRTATFLTDCCAHSIWINTGISPLHKTKIAHLVQWIGPKATAASVNRGVKNSCRRCLRLRWVAVLVEPCCGSASGAWALTLDGVKFPPSWTKSPAPGPAPSSASKAAVVNKRHYQEGSVSHSALWIWMAAGCNHGELKVQLKREQFDTRDMLQRTVRNYELRDASCVYLCGFSSTLWFCSLLLLRMIYPSLRCPGGIVL